MSSRPLDIARWNEVTRLFNIAVGLPLEGRASFLAAACGADAELRAEVESLLACDRVDATPFEEAIGRAIADTIFTADNPDPTGT
jgi:hypothetical protein